MSEGKTQAQRAAERRERDAFREAARLKAEERERALNTALAKSREKVKAKENPFDFEFYAYVRECPRLTEYIRENPAFATALRNLKALPTVRSPSTWEPHGKSAMALFRSLANHVLAKYPTPPFLWQAFFDSENAAVLIPLAEIVAKGGSLHKYNAETLKLVLTRKMCHDFLKTSSDLTVLQGLRYAQVRGFGGDARLARAICSWRLGREILSVAAEQFWATVMQWFAAQTMFDPAQVESLCDYLYFKRNEEAAFSMKGRTALALLRDKDQWHADLARVRLANHKGAQVYKPSGFVGAEYDFSRDDHREVWRVFEILTAKDLHAEGRRMGHCVFSYARMIESGNTSIWALTKEDFEGNWAMLTLEVHNRNKQIVQARGRFNRRVTTRENEILYRWCAQSGLTVSSYV